MKKIKINVCIACKKIYDEPKNEHCKNGTCQRADQAVFEINSTLFWNRVTAALSMGVRRDLYGEVRRAGKQKAAPKIETETPSKILTGEITD